METPQTQATELPEPNLEPGEKAASPKWMYLLLLALAVPYAYVFSEAAKYLQHRLPCTGCEPEFSFFACLFTLFYIPVVFILLLKRKRWGWILLFADLLFSFLVGCDPTLPLAQYSDFYKSTKTAFGIPFPVWGIFALILWRPAVAAYFGVSPETKERTALVAGTGTILFLLIVFLIL